MVANVAAAMGEHGVRRLVVTSSHALVARSPRFWAGLARLIFHFPYEDLRAMERGLADAPLDVTIARANMLTNKPGTGVLRAAGGTDFTEGHYQLSRDAYADGVAGPRRTALRVSPRCRTHWCPTALQIGRNVPG